jgi:hypothetical protein
MPPIQEAPEGFPLSLGRDFALTPGSDTPRGINESATRLGTPRGV